MFFGKHLYYLKSDLKDFIYFVLLNCICCDILYVVVFVLPPTSHDSFHNSIK